LHRPTTAFAVRVIAADAESGIDPLDPSVP
jgi:hypothetical protein